jgi:hypothetical protein
LYQVGGGSSNSSTAGIRTIPGSHEDRHRLGEVMPKGFVLQPKATRVAKEEVSQSRHISPRKQDQAFREKDELDDAAELMNNLGMKHIDEDLSTVIFHQETSRMACATLCIFG